MVLNSEYFSIYFHHSGLMTESSYLNGLSWIELEIMLLPKVQFVKGLRNLDTNVDMLQMRMNVSDNRIMHVYVRQLHEEDNACDKEDSIVELYRKDSDGCEENLENNEGDASEILLEMNKNIENDDIVEECNVVEKGDAVEEDNDEYEDENEEDANDDEDYEELADNDYDIRDGDDDLFEKYVDKGIERDMLGSNSKNKEVVMDTTKNYQENDHIRRKGKEKYPEFIAEKDMKNSELRLCMRFRSFKKFKMACKSWPIKNLFHIKFDPNDNKRC
ncbi:conserved hypothetical protein [Ricinus communis]|uniref:Uncharacterized protein n=1 Tax=Ricinus communis TaxID=3988 RepID=B9SW89_RICCO|nr:conserved hypothetical protein [Ricinus communis]